MYERLVLGSLNNAPDADAGVSYLLMRQRDPHWSWGGQQPRLQAPAMSLLDEKQTGAGSG